MVRSGDGMIKLEVNAGRFHAKSPGRYLFYFMYKIANNQIRIVHIFPYFL
jgi:hypothetical protein